MRKLERIFGKQYGNTVVKLVDKTMRRRSSDTFMDFWKDIANKDDIEYVMGYICNGLDKNVFEEKPIGLVEILKDYELRTKRVMDLACGIGRTCKWIAPNSKEYVGVDYVPKMIEKAKIYNEQFKNANFYVNDGKTLINFKDNSFDLVYCELAMQHMHKSIQKSYTNEVLRILKPDGIFLVQIPRIEFFKDENIARSEKEIKKLFSQYIMEEMFTAHRYYISKREKEHVESENIENSTHYIVKVRKPQAQ